MTFNFRFYAGIAAQLRQLAVMFVVFGTITFTSTQAAHAACTDPAAPNVNWSGCDLSGADLSFADLSGADLTDAILYEANLMGADLSNADLTDAYLYNADLSSANLTLAIIESANLTFANLSGANLTSAIIELSNLSSANLSGANLTSTYFVYSSLGLVDFRGTNMRTTTLLHCNFSGANLSGVDLSNTAMTGLNPFELNTPDITVGTDAGAATANVTFGATATLGFMGDMTSRILFTPANGSAFGVGTTSVTAKIREQTPDLVQTFYVTVTDDEAPVLAGMPANITQSTDAGLGTAVVNFTPPTASDNVDGAITPTVVSSPKSGLTNGSAFPIGTTTLTYTATDAAGNKEDASFTITVIDDEKPVVNPVNDMSFQVTPGEINLEIDLYYIGITATDNKPNAFRDFQFYRNGGLLHSSIELFPLGQSAMSVTMTDESGNVSDPVNFKINIVDAETFTFALQPTVTIPLDATGLVTLGIDNIGATLVFDEGVGISSVSTTPSSLNCGDIGTLVPVVMTIVDDTVVGYSLSRTTDVDIVDSTPPTIGALAAVDIQLDNAGTASVVASQLNANVTDACGLASFALTSSGSFTTADLGANTVAVSATDIYGNTATGSRTVNVVDGIAPVVVAKNASVTLSDAGVASITAAQIDNGSTDNIGIASISVSPSSFTQNDIGSKTVTLTVTDTSGNSDTATATVTVRAPAPKITGIQPGSNLQLGFQYSMSIGGTGFVAPMTVSYGPSGTGYTCTNLTVYSWTYMTCTMGPVSSYGSQRFIASSSGYSGPVSTATADFPAPNAAPVANAGPDQDTVVSGSTVTLDASGSTDNDGSIISYAWTRTGGTGGAITLSDATAQKPTFTADTLLVNATPVTHIFSLTATDEDGATSTPSTVTITVQPPVTFTLSLPATVTVPLESTGVVAFEKDNIGATIVLDAGVGISSITFSPTSVNCGNVGTPVPVTMTVVGDTVAGYTTSALTNVSAVDTTPPVIGAIAALDVQLDSAGTASVTGGQINGNTTDACGIASFALTSSGAFTGADLGANTVSVSATDNNGNTATGSRTVNVIDSIDPVAISKDVSVTLDASGTASITAAQVNNGSSDNAGIASISVSPSSFAGADLGVNSVTLTVTDTSGNSATATATVTLTDVIKPVITPPADIAQNTDAGLNTAAVTFVATAVDNSGEAIALIYKLGTTVITSPHVFAKGESTVTIDGSDSAGNAATQVSFKVTVSDGEKPVITPPADIAQNTDAGLNTAAVTFVATAVDNSGEAIALIYKLGTTVITSPHVFAKGESTVTIDGSDSAGNAATQVSFKVTVSDGEKPVITPPADIAQNTDAGLNTAAVTFVATAVDNSGEAIALIYKLGTTVITSPHVFAKGESTVTIDGSDSAGNAATQVSFKVTVSDGEKPVITPPADIAQNTDAGLNTAAVTFVATAVDNSGEAIALIYKLGTTVITSPHVFAKGESTVTIDGSDSAGNAATQVSFKVTVSDGEKPIITPPANQTAYTNAGVYTAALNVTGLGSVNDNSGGTISITYMIGTTVLTGSYNFAVGETTVTMDAVDAEGNNANQVSFTVTVSDGEGPVITPPVDQIVNTDAGTHTAAVDITGLGSVVDNSGGTAAITYKIGAIILTGSYNFAVGQTTVTMDATDAVGNHATQANFNVTVLDATDPVVALSSGTTVISGPETFEVNVVFSESVTGLVAADIAATNGKIMGLTGSGTTYLATVKATGLGKVSLIIPASVAVDIAGNGNIKSDTLTIEVSIVEDTQQMIAKFQNARATQLISNQPNLTGFLSGERSRSAFKLSLTEGRGTFNFVSAQNDDKRFWYRIGGSMTKDGTSDTSYLFGVIGSHFAATPSLLIGGLLEFDHLKQDDGASLIEGRGWLAGPYFVTKLAEQPVYVDGRLLYGQTTNDISPLGTFTDRFETERVLAQLKVSGALEFGKSTLRPSVQASYTSDQQKSYIDGFGNVIPEQGIELFEGAFGLEINHSVPLASASKNLDLTAGLTAIYSSTSGFGNPSTVAASTDGGRARVDFGLHYNTGKGTQFSVDSYLDGVGASDFEGYGLKLGFNVNF